MKLLDILIILAAAAGVFFAVRSIVRARKKGGCAGCGGNCAGCPMHRNSGCAGGREK